MIMLKTVLAAMLAATALVPAAAMAQDGHWHGRGGDNGDNGGGEARPARGVNVGGGTANRGGWNGGNRPVQAQPQAPQPQAQQPQFRGGGDRSGGWQNRGGDNRGGFNGNRGNFQPRVVQPQVQQPQGNAGRFNGGRTDGNRFNGNRYGGDNRGFEANRGVYRGGPGFQGNRGYRGGYNGSGYDRGGWNRDWRRDNRFDYGGFRSSNRYAFHLPRYYAPHGWEYGYRRFGIGYALSDILFAQDYWIDDPYDYRLPPAYGPYRWVRYYDDALLVDVESGEVIDAVYGIFW